MFFKIKHISFIKGLYFLKGCAIAVFGFFVIRLRGPIVENKPFNTSIDWFDVFLVVWFGIIYYFFLNKEKPNKA